MKKREFALDLPIIENNIIRALRVGLRLNSQAPFTPEATRVVFRSSRLSVDTAYGEKIYPQIEYREFFSIVLVKLTKDFFQ